MAAIDVIRRHCDWDGRAIRMAERFGFVEEERDEKEGGRGGGLGCGMKSYVSSCC
jgi:hypothetical protein